MQKSYLWHDYETFGIDPARDRPVQFAAIRTDLDFNEIDKPFMVYCQPADDCLPHPEACLVTGITPQYAREHGRCEADFIRLIHQEMSRPGTCSLGYNSLRFDDEVTRNTLYRNFFDPYAREWQNGNSRWDLIDLVRATCALRPEGIEWPRREDGAVSFRLEELTRVNGIEHGAAHDALADVRATIAMAALVRSRQPKLFDYFFNQRGKRQVSQMLNLNVPRPVLHVSGMFSAQRFHTALVLPLAAHPDNSNGVVVYDLSADPTPLLSLDIDTLKERLYTPTAELPEGVERLPLKTVHINRCPVLAPLSLVSHDESLQQRLQLDLPRCRRHFDQLTNVPGLAAKVAQVVQGKSWEKLPDPDLQLYSGGFFKPNDRERMTQIRETAPELLGSMGLVFADGRLDEMLLRYRARNYPSTLTEQERQEWQGYRQEKLVQGNHDHFTLTQFFQRINELRQERSSSADLNVLQALEQYGQELAATL